MLYLPKYRLLIISSAIIANVLFDGNYAVIANDSKIINGQTVDTNDDEQCSESDLRQYVEKIKKDIQSRWQPPKGFAERHVAVIFSVLQDGQIADAKINESSGSQEVDQSALAALKAASPLTPLPKGAPQFIQIRYLFSWQVTRH